MSRQGVTQQNRGGLGGIGQNRTNPLTPGSRLTQTSRMPPNQSQWPFPGAAPGLPAPQSRAPGITTSFAQTIGGNQQPSTPLDPSEFPTLSGGPSVQAQNHNPAIWSNQRQQTPVQTQQRNQSQPSNQRDQDIGDEFWAPPGINSVEDLRRATNGSNPQPGSVEEFPPLARTATGEIGGDRRLNMMSGANGFGTGASQFPPGIPPRTGQDALRNDSRPTQPGNDNGSSLFANMNDPQQLPIGTGQQQTRSTSGPLPPNNNTNNAENNRRNGSTPPVLTDEEKYGLQGLLTALKDEKYPNFDHAIGHDLTSLGLDLSSHEPLYPTYGGPLSTRPARAMTPEFTLPPCYTVTNVPPIQDKLPNFSDDTLFYIFYNYCGDVLQEQAAIELTFRNWRWHKPHRVWLQKDTQFGEPVQQDLDSERGRYIVFNEAKWRRDSIELILRYSDLDEHISSAPPGSLP